MTREEAKNWLNKLYARSDITDEYGDMEDMQPYEEAVNMAIKALEQTRWIPVSERLPMCCGEVLVTYRNKDSEERLVTVGRCEGCEWLIDDYVYPTVDVTAWMPLPEPYKAESEE